jgi:ubiquinone/menaquinone biosynthesis C-methylase UbiE
MAETEQTTRFTDGAGYEKFMGQWSRMVGRIFLDWLSLPAGLKWLDVGCGTGAFTEVIQQVCNPSEIVAIDPSAAQVSYATSRKTADLVQFKVADARAMPFENGRFDVAASALVLNFIPDREKAVAEMRRVVRAGGAVAAYVWDFAGDRGTAQHLHFAITELEGPGYRAGGLNTESTEQNSLKALFENAGLTGVVTRSIDISLAYKDFDDYWNSNTSSGTPIGSLVKGLTEEKRQRLKQLVKAKLPANRDGKIAYTARANAVRGGA